MSHPKFDREKLVIKPLSERANKLEINDCLNSVRLHKWKISSKGIQCISETAGKIKSARALRRPVILSFGAHTIKNGLAPVLIDLMKEGWVTHLATNGAGIIHDWEFSFQGKTSEDVLTNVAQGQFGIWEETGFFINLAIVIGAYEGLGYGESVGKMIHSDGLQIPEVSALFNEAEKTMRDHPGCAAAAMDLADVISRFDIKPGFLKIPHPYKQYSVQEAAYALNIPFTGHPMFGHDIIYTHPLNHGAAIGRTALHDFLSFADSVSHIENGIYISVGSAVMSPMVFEKSFSMSQNIEVQSGSHIDHHYMLIVDLTESDWDWKKDGEPPMNNPAYYLRFCKTFHRMGGEMHYLSADNRDFLLALSHLLAE